MSSGSADTSGSAPDNPGAPSSAPHETADITAEFVDLQVHTTASDGALAPARVVEAAYAANLVAIAITDHDTVDGIAEAEAAGAQYGVRIIPGVELSTHVGDSEIHMLGLHIQDTDIISRELAALQQGRIDRGVAIVATLNAHNIPVTFDAVLGEAAGGAVGRPHIARAMVAGGWVKDFREAFDKWLGLGKPAYVAKDRFDVADGIALVHRAGGLAIWAHPGEDATAVRVAKLAALGLDGVEALHPSHPPYLVQKIVALVEANNMVPSGGSDWHGTAEGPRRLGGQLVPRVWLDWQDARVAERLAQQASN